MENVVEGMRMDIRDTEYIWCIGIVIKVIEPPSEEPVSSFRSYFRQVGDN